MSTSKEHTPRIPTPPQLKATLLEIARENRKSPTPAEAVLWENLRGRKLAGFKFRRQQPIGRFVVDFYCSETRLAVEVDGGYHDEQWELDQERQRELDAAGCVVLRFSNDEVLGRLDPVLGRIEEACTARDCTSSNEALNKHSQLWHTANNLNGLGG